VAERYPAENIENVIEPVIDVEKGLIMLIETEPLTSE
jgi:hypothetical protein